MSDNKPLWDSAHASLDSVQAQTDTDRATALVTSARALADQVAVAVQQQAASAASIAALTAALAAQKIDAAIDRDYFALEMAAIIAERDQLKHALYLATRPDADCYVTVNATPTLISQLETAVSHVNNADLRLANPTARTTAMASLSGVFAVHNQPWHSFGGGDPWPWNGTGTRPAEPTAWGTLDTMCRYILQMGGRIMLTTDLCPWWMEGKLEANGTTTLCTAAEAFDGSGRLLTSRIPDFKRMVRAAARRYLVPPYNVRIWQTGVEYHGYFRGRDLTFKQWAWHDYAGTPGDNADCGLAYRHRITVEEILSAATELGIAHSEFTFVNNYPRIIARGVWKAGACVPSTHPLYKRVWGSAEPAGLDALTNMLPLIKDCTDAWAVDFSLSNADHIQNASEWESLTKTTDYLEFLSSEMQRVGCGDKKKVVSEWYDSPIVTDAAGNAVGSPNAANPAFRAAFRAEGYRRHLLAGVWLPITWSPVGRSDIAPQAATPLTDMSQPTGGQPTLMLSIVKMFHDNFAPGTPVYDTQVEYAQGANTLSAVASPDTLVLISQSASPQRVCVGDTVTTLGAYEVAKVQRG